MKIKMNMKDKDLEIKEASENDFNSIFEVYKNCEDFLSLGPESKASKKMVLSDMKISKEESGIYCCIYKNEKVIGIIDFIPKGYELDNKKAYISLIMIAQSNRKKGIGRKVIAVIENEILKNPEIREILTSVQENNKIAIYFWEELGYKIISGPEHRPDKTIVFHMQKEIERNRETMIK